MDNVKKKIRFALTELFYALYMCINSANCYTKTHVLSLLHIIV